MRKTRIFASLLALTMTAGLMTACGENAAESTEVVVETETVETGTIETETVETENVETETVETETAENETVETETVETETTETTPATETKSVQETQKSQTAQESVEVVPEKSIPEVTEETPAVESNVQETTPVAVNLPGENRNGRYADLPASFMPADGDDWYFHDEPLALYTWTDGIVANVYADYNKTQVIASFSYPANDATGLLLIAEQYNTGRGIVLYNNQYAIVAYDMLSKNPDINER